MSNRNKRKRIAEQTLEILEQGHFLNPSGQVIDIRAAQAAALAGTLLYRPADSDRLLGQSWPEQAEPTRIEVTGESSMEATRRLLQEGHSDVLCLNFASAKNPGGGFLGGSQAQEESLARSSGLYPSLLKAFEYYEVNRATKSCMYTDYMIYSPGVALLRDDAGEPLQGLETAAFLTAPAVNAGVVRQKESDRIPEIEVVMKRRIAKVLAIALEHGHLSLVLGAWGCGVFRNDPADMAQWFHSVIQEHFPRQFQRLVFAIYARDDRFIRPFQEVFS